jgi:hypothetical protein
MAIANTRTFLSPLVQVKLHLEATKVAITTKLCLL